MRTPTATGAVALAGVCLLLPVGGASYAAAPAHAVAPRSASPSPSASSREPDRAGSRAGEGRQRPGRAADEAEAADDASGVGALPHEPDEASAGDAEAGDGDTGDDSAATASPEAAVPATPAAPRDDVRQAAAQGERSDGPVLQILPLGSGLVLIGLGIALALAALRLRRG
ncbi:hypothetical protein ASE41_20275 [Streptomyces sp. Root264]|nr:hypothetical protein ASE41_20275 [Streptomyces sp. Root264]